MQVDFENTAGCSQREDQWEKKEKTGRKRSKRCGMKNDESLKTCSGTAVLIDLHVLYINNHNFSVTTDTCKLQPCYYMYWY